MRSTMRRMMAAGVGCAALVALALGLGGGAGGAGAPVPRAVARDANVLEVELCDGETAIQVAQNTPRTADEGRKIADALMAEWLAKNPDSNWIADERAKHKIVEPADNSRLVGQGQGQAYGLITKQDVLVWERETLAMVTRGSMVFHSADELGSTIAVSCDMCHPDASNTHPETYPKYQVQLGRTALLRDMINWCIEHPVRGTKLDADDPKMRALEAYIIGQRKGKPLDYGRR